MKVFKSLILLGLLVGAVSAHGQNDERGLFAGIGLGPGAPRVLTLLDYFESGRRAVRAFVRDEPAALEAELAAAIRLSTGSCVRVETRSDEEESRYRSQAASGVLIDGGRRVLTAGHAVEGSASARIVVTLVNGETRQARVVGKSYEIYGRAEDDWAVLELSGPQVPSPPATGIAAARPGEVAYILGYPDRIGVNADGDVAYDAGTEGGYLEPLATIAVVDSADPLRLSPKVGSVPTSGMSGAPVFDSRGRLIGIFVSMGKATTSTSAVIYTYSATSAASFSAVSSNEAAAR